MDSGFLKNQKSKKKKRSTFSKALGSRPPILVHNPLYLYTIISDTHLCYYRETEPRSKSNLSFGEDDLPIRRVSPLSPNACRPWIGTPMHRHTHSDRIPTPLPGMGTTGVNQFRCLPPDTCTPLVRLSFKNILFL